MERGIKNRNISENVEIRSLLKKFGFRKISNRLWKRKGKNKKFGIAVDVSFVNEIGVVKNAIENISAAIKKDYCLFISDDRTGDVAINCERVLAIVLNDKNGIVGHGRLFGSVELNFVSKNEVNTLEYAEKVFEKSSFDNCVKVTVSKSGMSVCFANEDLLDVVIMNITSASNKVDDMFGGYNMIEVKEYISPFTVSERMYDYFKKTGLLDCGEQSNPTRLEINAKEKCLIFFDGYNDVVLAALRQFSEDMNG